MIYSRTWVRLLLAAVALLVVATSPLSAQSYPDTPLLHGTLAFDANATLGAFTGSTSAVTGRMIGAPTLPAVRGLVEAPSRSLNSQNGKRDKDMRSSLEVEKFPMIRFELDSVGGGAATGDSLTVTLHGRFTLHGETRQVAIPGWIWRHGTQLRFRGATPVNLKDYHIGGLTKALGLLRMNEHIVVRIDVTFGPPG